jgi:hypothetical protein
MTRNADWTYGYMNIALANRLWAGEMILPQVWIDPDTKPKQSHFCTRGVGPNIAKHSICVATNFDHFD